MKIKVVCRNEIREELNKTLREKGFEIVEDAEFILYEKNHDFKKFIVGKQDENIVLIEYKDIIYFEAYGNETFCITNKGKFVIKEKLYQLEEFIILQDYIRVSKSVIVNILMIEEIIPWIGSKFILKMMNGAKLDVNRTYYNEFKKKLGL